MTATVISVRPPVTEAAAGDHPVYNFGAGPGIMPAAVLQQAQAEMTDWQGSGMSVWEMPFCGETFQGIADRARRDLRELLAVPDNFSILFMQGGASAQFSLVPMNLLARFSSRLLPQSSHGSRDCVEGGDDHRADYLETGHWSCKAIAEARRYCRVSIVASGASSGFCRVPAQSGWRLDPAAAYCHITSNETASGLQLQQLPDTGEVPLVVDMTSDFLSRPIDFQRLGLAYAGAQKNIGPAGLTFVIIRRDLITEPLAMTPSAFSYQRLEESGGRFNTPLTYPIYLAGLVFRHLLANGGLNAVQTRNDRKSSLLYRAIDTDPLYQCPVAAPWRSQMNVCFNLSDPALTERFLEQARSRGLINLAGHPVSGGVRASLYNAMPEAGVRALVEFMDEFSARHKPAVRP